MKALLFTVLTLSLMISPAYGAISNPIHDKLGPMRSSGADKGSEYSVYKLANVTVYELEYPEDKDIMIYKLVPDYDIDLGNGIVVTEMIAPDLGPAVSSKTDTNQWPNPDGTSILLKNIVLEYNNYTIIYVVDAKTEAFKFSILFNKLKNI